MGHASTHALEEDPALITRLQSAGIPAIQMERVVRIRVIGFDWNCPKYITPRFTALEVQPVVAPLRQRIAELEAQLGV